MGLSRGFTLIELITVILILGIVSVFAVPRLSGTEAFSVMGARDAGLSVARQVQLRAMQQQDPSDRCNALFVTAIRMGGSSDTDCQWQDDRSDVVDLAETDVRIKTTTTIFFDLLGRPQTYKGVRRCAPKECKFTFFEGRSTASICLNSEGYFHACD